MYGFLYRGDLSNSHKIRGHFYDKNLSQRPLEVIPTAPAKVERCYLIGTDIRFCNLVKNIWIEMWMRATLIYPKMGSRSFTLIMQRRTSLNKAKLGYHTLSKFSCITTPYIFYRACPDCPYSFLLVLFHANISFIMEKINFIIKFR